MVKLVLASKNTNAAASGSWTVNPQTTFVVPAPLPTQYRPSTRAIRAINSQAEPFPKKARVSRTAAMPLKASEKTAITPTNVPPW